jgi:spermidine/putrescine-binding protein
MKKIFLFLSLLLALTVLIGCDNREKLYVLNWEEYISKDLVREFEKEFGVKVVLDTATSNESMYNKIKNRSGKYDIVIPSDYMIERMHQEGLLNKLDYSKIPNYDVSLFEPNLQALRDGYFAGNQDYSVPYFWGALGIMYNKKKAGVKELVETHEWKVFFERDLIPSGVTVGMYDSSRDAVSAALLYLNSIREGGEEISLNTTDSELFNQVEELLRNNFFSQWGTDELKTAIVSQNLDIALVYSGDFFDQFYFALETNAEITFDMHVPTTKNNIWFDAMVIPNTATKVDLAHEFINFFLDIDRAIENTVYVGYCSVISAVNEVVTEDEDLKEIFQHDAFHPGDVNGEIYRHLGQDIALRMDEILTKAKIR